MWRKARSCAAWLGFGVVGGSRGSRSVATLCGAIQTGLAMRGDRDKRRARSLTRRVDCLLDVRDESVVSLLSLLSGDLQGDASSSKPYLCTVAVMCMPRAVAEMRPGGFMWLLESVDLENRVTLLRNA